MAPDFVLQQIPTAKIVILDDFTANYIDYLGPRTTYTRQYMV